MIETLLGAAFFAQTARVFAAAHPPQSPVLLDWGAAFLEGTDLDPDPGTYNEMHLAAVNPVLEALATLAFSYPKRAPFFRQELEHYLILTRDEGIDPLSLTGSYAGAMGLAQFMPSSYRAYAVDFDGDGHRDLWRNPVDAIGSVANYLAAHGWRAGEVIVTPAQVQGDGYKGLLSRELKPAWSLQQLAQAGVTPSRNMGNPGDSILLELEVQSGLEYWLGFTNFYVITRYNHSRLYAMAVYQLSQAIRQGIAG